MRFSGGLRGKSLDKVCVDEWEDEWTVDLDKQMDRQMGSHQHLGHGQTEASGISQELSTGWPLDTYRVDKSIVLGTLLFMGFR